MDVEYIEKYMEEYNYQDDSKDNNDFMIIFIICVMSIIFLTFIFFEKKRKNLLPVYVESEKLNT